MGGLPQQSHQVLNAVVARTSVFSEIQGLGAVCVCVLRVDSGQLCENEKGGVR